VVSFLELLVECRQFESTDPRDKVFALLSHQSAWVEHKLDGERDYCIDVVAAIEKRPGREVVAHEVAKARAQLLQDLHYYSPNVDGSDDDCPWTRHSLEPVMSSETRPTLPCEKKFKCPKCGVHHASSSFRLSIGPTVTTIPLWYRQSQSDTLQISLANLVDWTN
jgi:hypothetical protein